MKLKNANEDVLLHGFTCKGKVETSREIQDAKKFANGMQTVCIRHDLVFIS